MHHDTDDGFECDLPCELWVPSDMPISRVGEGKLEQTGKAASFGVVPMIYTETRAAHEV